jgi:hypothetical protein
MTDCHSPTADEVRAAREHLQHSLGIGITDAQDWCASAVCATRRAWQMWETGARQMHPAFWRLFRHEAATPLGEEK